MHVILRDGLEDGCYIAEHTNGFCGFGKIGDALFAGADSEMDWIPAQDIKLLARESQLQIRRPSGSTTVYSAASVEAALWARLPRFQC